MPYAKTVDQYLNTNSQWSEELVKLRKILLSTKLEECIKWGAPCYTHNGKNIVGIGGFKSYVGLWFYQGALLSDPKNVLINAQKDKTKAMRQWRFQAAKEIKATDIKAYVREAIEQQEAGLEIKPDRDRPVVMPPELEAALKKNKKAAAAFKDLTKGKQRDYANYIADAKRDATKQSRIDSILPMIITGQGLHDKYRDC